MRGRRHPRWSVVNMALAMITALLVTPALPALANHGTDPINVGVRESDGDPGRDEYDPSSVTVLTGTQVDFFFDNGFHNVVWTSTIPAALANSPGTPGGDTVGTTFSVTPTTPGTYIYFCSIHSTEGEALAATDFGSGSTAGMYGRVIVNADTTPPTWGAGSATATPISASQIDLTWPTATDDSGSVQYEVWEASGASNPGKGAASLVETTGATASSRTGLTAGVHYWYWITAVDGAGNAATPDQTADATTSSVTASASASGVVQFAIDPTLAISVSPPTLDLGALTPAAPAAGSATVNIQSNDTWSLNLKSVGRNGIDDAGGDDSVFTDFVGSTIPVGRATWDTGGAATTLTDIDAVVVTGQPLTASTDIVINYTVQVQFDDPTGNDYQTVVLYTVTQP